MSETIDILKCGACGALDPGPRDICPKCHAAAFRPHTAEGNGKLISWTIIRRPPTAFRAEGEYGVAVVRLDAGVTVTGRVGIDDPTLQPGTRVVATAKHKGVAVFAKA
jgi:hypothetical protein